MLYGKKEETGRASEDPGFQALWEGIGRMKAVHDVGAAYYARSKEWKECAYGWHNPLFPPEYRRCYLRGKEFEGSPACDMYYFMASYYQQLTGQKAPPNFEMDSSWRGRLAACPIKWDPIQQEAVLDMIACCTRWQSRRRVQNAGELLKKDFMKILAVQ